MDCTQPMVAATDNDDSNSSITSADAARNAVADKCVGVLVPVAGLDNSPPVGELRVMGGENKIGRVRDRCDITIDNKVRLLIGLSPTKWGSFENAELNVTAHRPLWPSISF